MLKLVLHVVRGVKQLFGSGAAVKTQFTCIFSGCNLSVKVRSDFEVTNDFTSIIIERPLAY